MTDRQSLAKATVNHYSRDGFAGSGAHAARPNYVPMYSRIEGEYAPYRFDGLFTNPSKNESGTRRGLPVPILTGDGVTISVMRALQPTEITIKNVISDEVHYVVAGDGCIKTDFGYLNCKAGDFLLLPRAVGYRLTQVNTPLQILVVATPGELAIDPFPPRGVLDIRRSVFLPKIQNQIPAPDRVFETVFCHNGGTTSHFYEFDPLDIEAVNGSPPVKKFSIYDLQTLGVSEGGITPPRLINDSTGQTLVFHLGSRRSDRPPIHVNADYDELIIYASGPGPYGSMDEPGTISWVPKGIPHHGAEEDTVEPYQAWLIETRASLELTDAGRSAAALMETGEYGIQRN